jgi:hypothetical protein
MPAPIDRRSLGESFAGHQTAVVLDNITAALPDIVAPLLEFVERVVGAAKRLQEVTRRSKSRGHPGKIETSIRLPAWVSFDP